MASETPLVYADFNKWQGNDDGKFVLVLTTLGTRVSFKLANVEPIEGLAVRFWTDDGDTDGNFDPLVAEGVLHQDPDDGLWVGICERETIMNVSETPQVHWARSVDWKQTNSALDAALQGDHRSSTLDRTEWQRNGK